MMDIAQLYCDDILCKARKDFFLEPAQPSETDLPTSGGQGTLLWVDSSSEG